MNVLIPVKRVIDPYVTIRVKGDGSGVETQNVKMAMNPFDEIAVEEAIRLKEQGIVDDILLVSIGENRVSETLRYGLALGADRALHISSDLTLQPLSIARALQCVVEREQVRLVILGKQAIDDDNNQTGQMLAGLLDWAQLTFASNIEFNETREAITVTREVDGGLSICQSDLPAVVTTDLRLNEPRYASLPNIMKAKSKPFEMLSFDELGVELSTDITVLKVTAPQKRQAGIRVSNVEELVTKLKTQAKVI